MDGRTENSKEININKSYRELEVVESHDCQHSEGTQHVNLVPKLEIQNHCCLLSTEQNQQDYRNSSVYGSNCAEDLLYNVDNALLLQLSLQQKK